MSKIKAAKAALRELRIDFNSDFGHDRLKTRASFAPGKPCHQFCPTEHDAYAKPNKRKVARHAGLSRR